MFKRKTISIIIVMSFALWSNTLFAKKVPNLKRDRYHFSLEYVNSTDTFNRSVRALGYDVNNLVYGLQGENCSPTENDIEVLSKGSVYGIFGYQFINSITFAGLAGYGESLYNGDKVQYGATCAVHIKFVNLSITYNTTSNWGLGIGVYLK
ncbi:hypothetical protein K4L44_14700 [Halosquirtibacter laminarini]|uniref:Uncharacterized protein n=1 Tax=Halosquirtibacter laminarini TaxID=3374600 RepID=A0AC61NQZ3_9BACT|nr:hypothetical protein K4L44_14700 [Prolixibacteraceae bacterium]